MSKILDNVDLGKAFDALKLMMDEIDQEKEADKSIVRYVVAYGSLKGAVIGFIKKCTGESISVAAANIDDLKDIKF